MRVHIPLLSLLSCVFGFAGRISRLGWPVPTEKSYLLCFCLGAGAQIHIFSYLKLRVALDLHVEV